MTSEQRAIVEKVFAEVKARMGEEVTEAIVDEYGGALLRVRRGDTDAAVWLRQPWGGDRYESKFTVRIGDSRARVMGNASLTAAKLLPLIEEELTAAKALRERVRADTAAHTARVNRERELQERLPAHIAVKLQAGVVTFHGLTDAEVERVVAALAEGREG